MNRRRGGLSRVQREYDRGYGPAKRRSYKGNRAREGSRGGAYLSLRLVLLTEVDPVPSFKTS